MAFHKLTPEQQAARDALDAFNASLHNYHVTQYAHYLMSLGRSFFQDTRAY